MIRQLLIISTLVLLLPSCRDRADTVSEYIKWINDPGNGLVKTKLSGDKEITVKYLPAEYLAYQELRDLESYTDQYLDSIISLYRSNRTFLLSIRVKENVEAYDIMYEDVSNYQEYAQKAMELNFNMENYITLNSNGEQYYPVLVNFENTYGLQNHRNIIVVFSGDNDSDLLHSGKLDLRIDDEIFHTGISHFHFKKTDIDKNIQTNFWKTAM